MADWTDWTFLLTIAPRGRRSENGGARREGGRPPRRQFDRHSATGLVYVIFILFLKTCFFVSDIFTTANFLSNYLHIL